MRGYKLMCTGERLLRNHCDLCPFREPAATTCMICDQDICMDHLCEYQGYVFTKVNTCRDKSVRGMRDKPQSGASGSSVDSCGSFRGCIIRTANTMYYNLRLINLALSFESEPTRCKVPFLQGATPCGQTESCPL